MMVTDGKVGSGNRQVRFWSNERILLSGKRVSIWDADTGLRGEDTRIVS